MSFCLSRKGLCSQGNHGYGFVIDFTERFRRVSEGLAILRLSSGDEIELPVPAEHEIISKLSPLEQRFDAFDLLCEFVRRAREEQHRDLLRFRKAALRVAGFVLVQREMERGRSPLVSIPPFAGIFKASGSTDPMKLGAAQGGDPRAAVHRLDEPTELSLSMVASPQCRFRFARQKYCSAAATSPANFRMPRSSGLIRRSKLQSALSWRSNAGLPGAVQIHHTKPGALRTGGRFVIGLGLTSIPPNSRAGTVNLRR